MAPLIVQIIAFVLSRAGFAIGLPSGAPAMDALRYSFAAMFFFTGVTHLVPRVRRDLIRMVPPRLPWPDHLVTLTGVLEMAGAASLLILPNVRPIAAALAILLVAMFPANFHADRAALTIAGRRATPMKLRLPLQLFWIALLLWMATNPASGVGLPGRRGT